MIMHNQNNSGTYDRCNYIIAQVDRRPSMSTVILDTITGKSTATTITIGSTPVVSASANSMTIRGEGSAQTSIQQGLAKVWIIDGTGN